MSRDNESRTDTRTRESRESKEARDQFEADFKWLMDSSQGRRLVHGWLQATGVYAKSYTGNSETFYREGRRSFGLDLLGNINTLCPPSFITMLEEQQNGPRDPNPRTE